MDWSGVVSSAAGSLGDLLTGGYFSRKSWERQKEAMKHAHQWEVQDLRAAGLNPILSAGGSGASTGGLTSPMVESNFGQAVADGFSNALKSAQVETQEASAKNIEADTDFKGEQILTQRAMQEAQHAAARVAAANAEQVELVNRFYKDNPNVFAVKMSNQAMPGVGGAMAAANLGVNEIVNGAKQFGNVVKQAVKELHLAKPLKHISPASSDPKSDSWNGGD